MADRITKVQRSKIMSSVRSRGNKTTEQGMLSLFRENKVKGWRRHYKRLPGTPDFVFVKQKVAIFVDGCFWHGCRCSSVPKSNVEFWENKIAANKKRDRRVVIELRRRSWNAVRVWEHQIKKNPKGVIRSINKVLGNLGLK